MQEQHRCFSGSMLTTSLTEYLLEDLVICLTVSQSSKAATDPSKHPGEIHEAKVKKTEVSVAFE